MKKYIITIVILFVLIGLFIGGYFIYSNAKANEANSVDTLKAKCTSELEYLSSNIILMMNQLNNISFENYEVTNDKVTISNSNEEDKQSGGGETKSEDGSGGGSNSSEGTTSSESNTVNSSNVELNSTLANNNKIDWNLLKADIETMYSSWTTILMDLTTLNVNKDNLLKYNDKLGTIVENFEGEDKKSALINLADLYNLLTLYIQDFSTESYTKSRFIVTSNILYAYANIETDDWNKTSDYIGKAKTEYANIVNGQVNNVNKIDKINKAYILINEIEKNASNKNKNVFYVNYRNLIQELENL